MENFSLFIIIDIYIIVKYLSCSYQKLHLHSQLIILLPLHIELELEYKINIKINLLKSFS